MRISIQAVLFVISANAYILTSTVACAVNIENLIQLSNDNRCFKCDLSLANLKGVNLSGAYLKQTDLKGADLRGTNLMRTNLILANLEGADLSGAYLKGADLAFAKLAQVNFFETDLSKVNLQDAIIDDKTNNQRLIDNVLHGLSIIFFLVPLILFIIARQREQGFHRGK